MNKGILLVLIPMIFLGLFGNSSKISAMPDMSSSSSLPSISLNPTWSQIKYGEKVSVDVMITSVADLYGWEFKLFYETNCLDAVEVTEGSFLQTFAGTSGTYFGVQEMNDAYNSTHGLVWAYCVMLGTPAQPASGSGVFATVEFEGTGGGTAHMELAYPTYTYPAKLSNIHASPIACTTALGADIQVVEPLVSLYPSITRKIVGEDLSVDVKIAEVFNLYGWEFKLFYETNCLDAVEVTEGSFLQTFAGTSGTYFGVQEMNDAYNSTHGLVWAYCVMLGTPAQPATGEGVLATVRFTGTDGGAAHMELAYPTYTYPAKLSNIHASPIPCTTTTGIDALIVGATTVPLDVHIDVGAIYFVGEQVELYVMTSYRGISVTPTYINVVLYYPDGETATLTPQEVATGFYKLTYTIPSDASSGTWAIVADAAYFTDDIQASGTFFKTYLISSTLNSKLVHIDDTVALIQTNVGLMQVDIDSLQMQVTAIQGSTATIQTTLGTIQGTITSINGNIATIRTDIGTIKLDISTIKDNTTPKADWTTIGLYISMALLVSIVAALVVLYLYMRARFRSGSIPS